ncbi:MobF family relaxase [Tautonia sociabilis]|uniref:MobF family relaxase n=1 Tax=Tautonia sociabilis TaxID=2080755 RepID=UPI00131544B8|nr:MobF family relaxase [Tautonia sociabilis]
MTAGYLCDLTDPGHSRPGVDAAGRWFGRGCPAFGISGEVRREDLEHLMWGFAPGGRALVRNAGEASRRAGYDLTFSADKDVSALWAVAGPKTREIIERAQREAVKQALTYLQDVASHSRRGRHGLGREPVGLVAALFEQGSSRAGEPQLHTHAFLANVAARADGSSGALDGRDLYMQKRCAGAIYRCELARRLEERLGVRIERKGEFFGIAGVPAGLTAAWSTRRREIEEHLERHGRSGPKAAEYAALATRPAGRQLTGQERLDGWRREAARHGFTPEAARALMGHFVARDPLAEAEQAVRRAVRRITERDAHFGERELLRLAAGEALGRGVGASLIRTMVTHAVEFGPDTHRLGQLRGERRYTTGEMLEAEQRLLEAAGRLSRQGHRTVTPETMGRVLASRPTLTAEQSRALVHITQESGRIAAATGIAGEGRAFVLDAVREAYEGDGCSVFFAAADPGAARELERGAKIPGATLHETLRSLERGVLKLDDSSVIVVDESGIVATRAMERLTYHVESSGAKLVLVGEADPSLSLEAGGSFGALAARLDEGRRAEVLRRRRSWARDAGDSVPGHTDAALRTYAERGLLTLARGSDQAMAALVADWERHVGRDPRRGLVIAPTDGQARALNRLCQEARLRAGELGDAAVVVSGERIRAGDRVRFTRGSRLYQVRSGHLGTVLDADPVAGTLKVRLDDGERITVSLDRYGHVRLGYALTAPEAHDARVEDAFVLGVGASAGRGQGLVLASRTRLYADERDAGEEVRALVREASRAREKGHLREGARRSGDRERPDVELAV